MFEDFCCYSFLNRILILNQIYSNVISDNLRFVIHQKIAAIFIVE